MTASWPGTLPQKPKYGFQEQRQRNVASFVPDAGAPKIRRRSTAVVVAASAVFQMTDTQLAAFNTFYETTLADGTLPFTWNHPRTGVSYTWSFSADAAPVIEGVEYQFNSVSCTLLRLP